MAAREFSFTSESVTEGHPDKIADQVSDAVLDAVLTDDPTGRVACETLITTGLVVVAGEITTETYVDIPRLVRKTIGDIGYTRAKYGFDAETCGVIVAIDEQSADIAQGVDDSFEAQHGDDDPLDRVGAGDQGMMFGYASNETDELMPLPIQLAHKITKRLSEVRKADVLPYLRPDGKAQVTIRYEVDEHGRQRPVEIERILVSTQHRDGLDSEALIKPDLVEHVLHPILPHSLYDEKRLEEKDFVYVNPTGKFVIGGPMGDTGLTGRKIIVDTYGGAAPHGGGAFSGKDPTKVDRSAAYAARYVAKNVVAAGLAERCQIQVAYAIGVAHPLSVLVDTFGTEAEGLSQDRIEQLVREHFDLRPAAILRDLDLRRPIYEKTAAYGHFGRDDRDFTWERTDKADKLREAAGLAAARNRLARPDRLPTGPVALGARPPLHHPRDRLGEGHRPRLRQPVLGGDGRPDLAGGAEVDREPARLPRRQRPLRGDRRRREGPALRPGQDQGRARALRRDRLGRRRRRLHRDRGRRRRGLGRRRERHARAAARHVPRARARPRALVRLRPRPRRDRPDPVALRRRHGVEQELYPLAEEKLADAARDGSGLLARAERNTRLMLEGLLRSLGFTRVEVRFSEV